MSIESIDYDLCNNCKICWDNCPMDIFRFDEKNEKVIIQHPEECICCFICDSDCPKDAIYVSPFRSTSVLPPWG